MSLSIGLGFSATACSGDGASTSRGETTGLLETSGGPGGETTAADTTGSMSTSSTSGSVDESSGTSDGSSTGDESSSGEDDGSSGSDTGMECTDEVCDGVDNDCDDEVDEVCDCQPMTMQQCYSGPMGTENVGKCLPGTQTCNDQGQWDPCMDEVLPDLAETCNAIDDDCDGATDEDFGDESCGEGVCYQLVDTCADGTPQECTPLAPPDPAENCEGTDDDCDGEIDEGCNCTDGMMQGCYPGPMGTQDIGICVGGMQTCVNGQWGACMNAVVPLMETCDTEDDDCDGMTDEGTGGAGCNTGVPGVCVAGQMQCQAGMLQCTQTVFPSGETCDGLDNDCDAMTDEALGGGNCNTGLPGVCSAGTNQCQGGIMNCVQNNPPVAEQCDSADNDCDGMTDEGNPGGGLNCGTGMPGECNAGTTTCAGGMIQCNQNQAPAGEICDALDNDCDGMTDEGVCLGPPGDCCVATNGDGCESNSCTTAVCAVDPSCCDTGWDAMCAAVASNSCGGLCVSISACDEVDLGNDTMAAGSTVGSSNSYAANCGGESGPEVAFEFTATTTGLHVFDTFGSAFDTVLWATSSCGGAILACNDDTGGLQSQISFNINDGQTVLVFVGGYFGATGNYVLNVNPP